MSEFKIKVGSKGDIYLRKEIQQSTGINPKDIIILTVANGEITIKKEKTFLDLARTEPILIHLSQDENKKLDEEINEWFEN